MTAIPNVGDSDYRLLQKLLLALGGSVYPGDPASRVLGRCVEQLGGVHRPGDNMRDLWARFAALRGVSLYATDSVHTLIFRLAGSASRFGDTTNTLLRKIVEANIGYVVPATTWTPIDAPSTLFAWYKADAGLTLSGSDVTQWADQSGNGRHLTSAAGKYPSRLTNQLNGLPSVSFNGVANGHYMKMGAQTQNQPLTVYMLFRQTAYTQFRRIYSGLTDGYLYQAAASAPNLTMRTGGSAAPARTDIPVGTFFVVANTWNGASSTFWKNRQLPNVGNSGTGAFGGIVFGASNLLALNGAIDLVEVVVRTGAQTSLEQSQHANYLMHRAGFGAKQLIAEGDSITVDGGLTQAQTYPPQFVALKSPTVWSYAIQAVGGSQITDLVIRESQTDDFYDSRNADNWLSVLIGRNDLVAGTSVGDLYAAIRGYCLRRRAAGWKVALCTVLPCTVSGFNTKRNELNGMLRANYTQFADGLVDLAGNASIGPDSAASNLTYYSDGTHLTAAGQTIFANEVSAVIP